MSAPPSRADLIAAVRGRVERFVRSGDRRPILEDAALAEATALIDLLGDGPDLEILHTLGVLHWMRYQVLPENMDQRDLMAALTFLKPVHGVAPHLVPDQVAEFFDKGQDIPAAPRMDEDEDDQVGRRLQAAVEYLRQAERTGRTADVDKGLELLRALVDDLPPDHPLKVGMVMNLSMARHLRFELGGDPADLDEAVRAGRTAVDLAPAGHPDHADVLAELSAVLRTRFLNGGDPADLDAAVRYGQEAVHGVRTDDPRRSRYLSVAGTTMRVRYEFAGDLADLDTAIEMEKGAVDTDPEDATTLSNLGASLRTRYARTGNLGDLDEAVEAGRAAIRFTPPHHHDRAGRLSNLGNALLALAAERDDLAALDEAVEVAREARRLSPAGSPGRLRFLSNAAMALRARYERLGDLADLDEGIEAAREAAAAAPAGHPERIAFLTNLGNALGTRYEHTGDLPDLAAAIEAGRDAAAVVPARHPQRATLLSGVANQLLARAERTGDPADLDRAVQAGQEALDAVPAAHPDRVRMQSNLGNALAARFYGTGDPGDLDRAIELGRAAANVPPGHPQRAVFLSNLGSALATRYERTKSRPDLDEAIAALRDAVAATPPDHPNRALSATKLGSALGTRALLTGDVETRDEAAAVFAQAARLTVAPPSSRVIAAGAGAWFHVQAERWREGAEEFEQAVRLLPLMAPRRVRRETQEHWLGQYSGIASDAAACALNAGRPERAVTLLEAGRGVLLAQAIEARTSLTELRAAAPDLAARFAALRDELDAQGSEGERRREMAEEFEALIAEIRRRAGFERFLMPPAGADLVAEAGDGPIALINVSGIRCDALLLTETGVRVVPLTAVTRDGVTERVAAFLGAVRVAHDAEARVGERLRAEREVIATLEWLWDAIAEPVLEALGFLGTPAAESWPRIWWSPGGLLGYLPLHAAGHHDDVGGATPRTVVDRVVSSYTPTVRALRHARGRRPAAAGPGARVMVVAMPRTPMAPDLRGADRERELVAAEFPGALTLLGEEARHDRVLAELPSCAVAHFACHGVSHPASPSDSRLLVHDHVEHPLTVLDVARLNLDADLAYLSACETARTAARLADEAIHLSSAFQIAGYAHVIGTLWTIADDLAVEIATDVYQRLPRPAGGPPDCAAAAVALHAATRRIRDRYPKTPTLWAAHVHAGA